ncbi:unnamed protein product [Durusdinium trenchii]|uniref:Uncharacterized protein n=1 Tax=Durusdinium trenchii TaxID=1381693 RepID=A0ABP0P858_9DINO
MLALVRGCSDRPGVVGVAGAQPSGHWRIADIDSKLFGDIVPEIDLTDATKNVLLQFGDFRKRLHVKDGQIFSLEFVSDFDSWSNAKRPGLPGGDAGDLRLLGCSKLASGKRQISLEKALESMSDQKFDDWPHRGPKATKEFLESVLQNGGDLMTYHSSFMRKSGLSDNSAASHEYKNLLNILRLAISYDQVDVSNLACIEQTVRRVLEIQIAVRRNPKHPTFDAFDYNLRGTVDEVGGARAFSYAEWVAEQQKVEAKTLKSTREWREEQAADRRRAGRAAEKDDSEEDDHGGDGGKKKKKKKNKKTGVRATHQILASACFRIQSKVIKSKDMMYSLSQCNVAPYDPDLLKVTKTATVPKPATQLLPAMEASWLEEPDQHIVRSAEEIAQWAAANGDFHPYWDETLRTDRMARHDLYRKLCNKSLIGFRKRIRAKVGLFFVWKSSRKGIRLIVDARMPNACHKRPPKTKLGGASAIADVDAFADEDDLALLNEGYGGPVELPCKMFGDTGDVSDAFYQFSVAGLADWFGLDDPVRAADFEVTSVWDPDSGCQVDVDPDEMLFPVFLGMPQGWVWALHFCNTAVEYGMSKAIPATQFVKEGMPPPDPRCGPISSVYVDNIGVFGFVEKVVDHSFDQSVANLERAGFVLHELNKGNVEVVNVGIVLYQNTLKIRHIKNRAWRLQ